MGSNKAMKLGTKAKDVDSFVDKLRSEGTGMTKFSVIPAGIIGFASLRLHDTIFYPDSNPERFIKLIVFVLFFSFRHCDLIW